jgi:hypothetical protein
MGRTRDQVAAGAIAAESAEPSYLIMRYQEYEILILWDEGISE